jgi:hypothetical protein
VTGSDEATNEATLEAMGEAAVTALEAVSTTVSRASLLMDASSDCSALCRWEDRSIMHMFHPPGKDWAFHQKTNEYSIQILTVMAGSADLIVGVAASIACCTTGLIALIPCSTTGDATS